MPGESEESLDALTAKIKAGSNELPDYLKLGSLLFKLGRYQECFTILEKARDLSHNHFDTAKTCITLGWTAYALEKYDQARQFSLDALSFLAAEQDAPEVCALRGEAKTIEVHCEWVRDREAGEWVLTSEKAKQTAHEALTYLARVPFDCVAFEDKAPAFYSAANIQSLLGNTEECLRAAALCLKISQDDWERASCLTLMAETLRGASRLQEAQGAINEALECALPWKCLLPKLWLEKGLLERLKDRPLEAQCSFGQALRLIESDFLDTPYRHMRNELYANLGAACFEVGDIRGAIETFRSVLIDLPQNDPYYVTVKVWLGRCLESSGDHDGAQGCFCEVLQLQPDQDNRTTALEGLGRISYGKRDYGKAAELFGQLIPFLQNTDPRWISARLWLACCHEGLGDTILAQEGYEIVLCSEGSSQTEKRLANDGLGRLVANIKQTYH